MTEFVGKIGTLRFVTGKVAFRKAASAQKEGRFGRVNPKSKAHHASKSKKAVAKG